MMFVGERDRRPGWPLYDLSSGIDVLEDPHGKWGSAKPGRNIGSANSMQDEFFVPPVLDDEGFTFRDEMPSQSKPEA
jgi:hypothetical protein